MSKWPAIAIVASIFIGAGFVASFDPFAWEADEEITIAISCPEGSLVWGKGEILDVSIFHRGEDEEGEFVLINITPSANNWREFSELSRRSIGDECQLFAGRIHVESFVVEQEIWEGPMIIEMRNSSYAERLVAAFDGVSRLYN